jgi:hypothetical protein
MPPDVDIASLYEGDKCFFREVRKEAEETTDDPIKAMASDRVSITGCCQDAEKPNRKSNRANAPGLLRPAHIS